MAAGILPAVILAVVFLNVTENTVVSTRLNNVRNQFNIFSTYLSNSNHIDELLNGESGYNTDEFGGMFYSRLQVVDRNFEILVDSYQINKGKICVSQDINKCFLGTNSAYVDKENKCIVLVQAIKNSEDVIEYVVFATSSISDVYSAMSTVRMTTVSVLVILAIILIAVGVLISVKLVKPFESINEVIDKIDKGHMADDINLKGSSEIEDISSSFNIMLGKINSLEQSRQEFVSNVSHELKTPLTSLKVLADSLLANENVPAEMYREFMEDMSSEINRENVIISDLLTLVKMDNQNVPLNITNENINDIIESTLKIVRPLAEKKNIELILETYRPIMAEVDKVKLSMAISNLVENAVKYNNNEGWVRVSLNADQTYFYIKIQDNGFGIPKESQARVFDRFYRVDKARSREAGGTGLGLAITKSIILSHNGDIKLYSEEGEGTTFSMQIPLTHVLNSK